MSDWDDSPNNSPHWHPDMATSNLSHLLQQQQSRDSYQLLASKLNTDQLPEEIHIPGTNPPNPSLMQSSSGDEKCSYSSPRSKSPTSSISESRSSPLEMSPSSSEGSSTPIRRSSLSSESRTPPLTRLANASPTDKCNSPASDNNFSSLLDDECYSPTEPNGNYNSLMSNNSSPLSNNNSQLSNDVFPLSVHHESYNSLMQNENYVPPMNMPSTPPSPPSPVESLPQSPSPVPLLQSSPSPEPSVTKSPSPVRQLPKSLPAVMSQPKSMSPEFDDVPADGRESYTPPLPPPPKHISESTIMDDRQSYTPPLPCTPSRDSYTPPLPDDTPKHMKSPTKFFVTEEPVLQANKIILPESISLPSDPPPPPLPAAPDSVVQISLPQRPPSPPPVQETLTEMIPLPSSPLIPNITLPLDNANSFNLPHHHSPSNTVSSTVPEQKVESTLSPLVPPSPFMHTSSVPPNNFVAQNTQPEHKSGMFPGPGIFPSVSNPQVTHVGQPFMYYNTQQPTSSTVTEDNIPGINPGMHPGEVGQFPEVDFQTHHLSPTNACPQNMFPGPDNMDNCPPSKRMREGNLQRQVSVNNGDYHYPPKNENHFAAQPGQGANNNFKPEYAENYMAPHPNPSFFQNGNGGPPPPSVHNVNGKNFPPRSSNFRPPLLRSPILRSPPDGHFPGPRPPFPPRTRPSSSAGLRQSHPQMPGGHLPASEGGRPPPPPPPAPPGVPGNLWEWFLTADQDKDGYITARELQCILLNGNWSPFSEERCRMMVDMLDRERTGTINAYELTTIWNCLCEWKTCFEELDAENFGLVNSEQLTAAFSKFGYNLSSDFSKVVIGHFGNELETKLTFDDFIHSCIMLKSLTDAFQVYDTNKVGTIDLHYEQFLEMVLDNIVGSPYHPV